MRGAGRARWTGLVGRSILMVVVVTVLASDAPVAHAQTSPPASAAPETSPPILIIHPSSALVESGQSQTFAAFVCFDSGSGIDLGLDGVPGTADDSCTPVTAEWAVSGGIGTISPLAGHETVFTAGPFTSSGTLFASISGLTAFASIIVSAPPPPPIPVTHLVIFPSTDALPAGATQTFAVFRCPDDGSGAGPDLGADGIPGTADDACIPVTGAWSVNGNIGAVDPPTGHTTVLTASVPSGSFGESGEVVVTDGLETATAPVIVTAPTRLVVHPVDVTLTAGETQTFEAFRCLLDADGQPALGADGIPGTADDSCIPVTGSWTVDGEIGTVDPVSGHTTTLTAAIPVDSAEELGQVIVFEGGDAAAAIVTVLAESRLFFVDADDAETTELLLFEEVEKQVEHAARSIQKELDLGKTPKSKDLDALDGGVPLLFRYRVGGETSIPPPGPVAVLVTSLDAAGAVIDTAIVVLELDGDGNLRSREELVFVPEDSPLAGAPFGNILFLVAQVGGRILAQASLFFAQDGSGTPRSPEKGCLLQKVEPSGAPVKVLISFDEELDTDFPSPFQAGVPGKTKKSRIVIEAKATFVKVRRELFFRVLDPADESEYNPDRGEDDNRDEKKRGAQPWPGFLRRRERQEVRRRVRGCLRSRHGRERRGGLHRVQGIARVT